MAGASEADGKEKLRTAYARGVPNGLSLHGEYTGSLSSTGIIGHTER